MHQFEYPTLPQLLTRAIHRHGSGTPLFGALHGDHVDWTTYGQFERMTRACAAGMQMTGVQHGDRVALISNNRLEWAVVAYACFRIGAIVVPLYERQKPQEWAYAVQQTKPALTFVANAGVRDALHDALDGAPVSALTLTADGGYGSLMANGRAENGRDADVRPEDVACIFYTSGSSGKPKGVMLTHANLTSNVEAVASLGLVESGDRTIAYLYFSHIMGSSILHGLLSEGAAMVLCDDPEKLKQYLQPVQPTILFAAPRVLHKAHANIAARFSRIPKWLRGALSPVLNRKVRQGFGGKLRWVISGSAKLRTDVAVFFNDAGIPIIEGYGQTETSPAVCVNYDVLAGGGPIGSVGRPVRGVEVRISDEGEILVRGPNVMAGYYLRPDQTQRAIRPDGFLKTGDRGHLDEYGRLHITGRIADEYKLENGMHVNPAFIEDLLRQSPLIANVAVFGLNRPHNVALIVPDQDALAAAVHRMGLECDEHCTLLNSAQARVVMDAEINRLLADVKGFERIGAYAMLHEDFSVEKGTLTPTMKPVRGEIERRHADVIGELYLDDVAAQ